MPTLNEQESEKGAYLILGQPELPNLIEVGRRYDLNSDEMLISNRKEARIPLPSRPEENYSVLIYRTKGIWSFENRGQPGSVLLNGYINEERELKDGDLLQIGGTVFHFLEGIGIQSNIYAQMIHLTRVDLLTGAYNKAHFGVSLEDWINLSKRHTQSLALIVFDIDHFKKVNDTYGHLVGDAVLKQVAERVLHRVRKGDVFCRNGGEEFALILPETRKDSAVQFAEELRHEIAKEPFLCQDISLSVTISLGVAEYQKGMTKVDFEGAADRAMYAAKHTGRNRVMVADSA